MERGFSSAPRRLVGRLIVTGLLLFSTACSLVDERRSAGVAPPLPETFLHSGAGAAPPHWWRALADPQLDALVERALRRNFSLRAAWDRLDQAAALAREAGAAYYPTLDASATATRNLTKNGAAVGDSRFLAGLGAAYEVDLWGRVHSSAQAAELDHQASAAQLQTAALSVSSKVANTWYRLAADYAQAQLLDQQLDTNEKVLELVTLRFRHGRAGAIDVLQQRQLAESTRGDLALARAAIAVTRQQLAVLLGGTAATLAVPEAARARLIEVPPLPATGVPVERLQQRPDVRRDWLALRAADRRVAVAVAERYPRLSLTADASGGGDRARDLFGDWLSNLSANLLLPVIDGGRRRAALERARAVSAEALDTWRQALVTAFAEAQNALEREQRQHEYLASIERQLQLSKQTIERLRDSYRNGAVDYLRVLDALLTDQALERTALEARRQLIEFRIDLHRALAGGWEPVRPPSVVAGGA
jgi:NodT family efflux transporter outer membrane factor (OMF) lipoprotein